jgi:uncharacterized protein YjbI with pentapeptide repeats
MHIPGQSIYPTTTIPTDPMASLSHQSQAGSDIRWAQKAIYRFFLHLVKHCLPEAVLLEFKYLFFEGTSSTDNEIVRALYEILFCNHEQEFRYTLKRCCYILINNWYAARQYRFIPNLIQLIAELATTKQPVVSDSLKRLRAWLKQFVESEDYQELKILAASPIFQDGGNWSDRYTSYRLVSQYTNPDNSLEQRQVARELSRQLKKQFRQDLALFTARYQAHKIEPDNLHNPTKLSDKVIVLIKNLVYPHTFNYINYAHIFTEQVKGENYQTFKKSLLNYLVFPNKDFGKDLDSDIWKVKLSEKLDLLHVEHHQNPLEIKLTLQTCNRILDYLTTEDHHNPSELLIFFLLRDQSLLLAILLLKIVLICPYVRAHLDTCIAQLIHYYEGYSARQCQPFIQFLEVFNVVFAIYAENTRYNLVQHQPLQHQPLQHQPLQHQSETDSRDLEANSDQQRMVCELVKSNSGLYENRIFSQFKGADLRNINLSGADLRGVDLCGADLRGANLRTADLTGANLSFAKLGKANLCATVLNHAQLVAIDLQEADLTGASLAAADLSRAQLQGAKFLQANLATAKLYAAMLQQANLNHANLNHANLSRADLTQAILEHADLQSADLNNTQLAEADFRDANLAFASLSAVQGRGASFCNARFYRSNLRGANLNQANLRQANLYRADLAQANFETANLAQAFLRSANLVQTNLVQANLTGADLSRSQLKGAQLTRANLTGSILRHSVVEGANFELANFESANLFGTDLLTANWKNAHFKDTLGLSLGLESQVVRLDI